MTAHDARARQQQRRKPWHAEYLRDVHDSPREFLEFLVSRAWKGPVAQVALLEEGTGGRWKAFRGFRPGQEWELGLGLELGVKLELEPVEVVAVFLQG